MFFKVVTNLKNSEQALFGEKGSSEGAFGLVEMHFPLHYLDGILNEFVLDR